MDKNLQLNTSVHSTTESTAEAQGYTYGSQQILARDMSKIVNRKLFSDVCFIVGSEKEKIWGHRCILSARSSIFHQLFINEPNKYSFDLGNVKPLPFLLLLYFIYTNSISFDRLDIYEVFDLLRLAEDYKCEELADLAERQMGYLVDPKSAFEFLPIAMHIERSQLKANLLEYIEEFSTSLLVTSNEDILRLTPKAMKAILESDQLDIDELRAVEVARYWAENYLERARENSANAERDNARASIIKLQSTSSDSTSDSLETNRMTMNTAKEEWNKYSSATQEALEQVADVMSALRLALIPPTDLLLLEEENLKQGLIPEQCFISAWRVLATQGSPATPDEKRCIALPRKGSITRTQRRKSFIDPQLLARKSRSFTRLPEFAVAKGLDS
ncbi:hypothetical protein FBUS_00932 [Fasciolopsis buskii]|uniref:BTB domain-containing protein n=1 Tax=Fasciolopsis buskii TaxID=27845 RepID=A0A8E0RVA6_9TREM|nr:hypothetical protein FBUS_00932 [Fasciolopsis buski]